ncbi:four-carbon acid sugar kinase family protein [Parageobacillus sp. VR-IP]|uniref:four-carbon acid sugar kinase family protein n=1 Tax=Parageobacillus sp. VR-IP TaxID=2742205 RepID=UPI001581C958|nr:four-carbon acid sugar kinase family protein [Parageobacillus sp. VR-IP]NUK30265.1 four-carbon acid sugar kinase family protein [Parageobacillus sp. VR-IP]
MMGIVADDITGANDIGAMFAKSNYVTHIYRYDEWEAFKKEKNNFRDVLILDTDSRFDSRDVAYKKVFRATKALQRAGATQFFNKTCSVFRGNVGAEFDAMLDALEENFAVIVLGFPKNGRKTINGIHYVHGVKLENSEFSYDPIHPMTNSNLLDILQSQTKRKVTVVGYEIVKKGAAELRKYIHALKDKFQYIILDVTDQEDLRIIAEAVYDMKVLAGSSALAEELAAFLGEKKEQSSSIALPPLDKEKGIFCAAGSLMPQTAAQIDYMYRKGAVVFELNSLQLLDENKKCEYLEKLTAQIIENIQMGHNVVLHSSNRSDVVKKTKAEALKKGMNNKEVCRLVSSTIANITKEVIQKTNQKRFVIAGGDTSAAVCRSLGIYGMRVWREIQTGLPSCISLSKDPMLFVLKSGSFGKENFIDQAIAHLKAQ